MENWKPINTPTPKGIFTTLNSEFTAYHPTDPAYLTSDGHGIDVNPGCPEVGEIDLEEGGKGKIRGPFKTLFFVKTKVHCTETGDLIDLPFTFGHVDEIEGPELVSWMRICLNRMFEHEVDEAL